MILKIKENESWKFIDNVKECTVGFNVNDVEGSMKGHLMSMQIGNEWSKMYLEDTVYLLNNEGKTIERLTL